MRQSEYTANIGLASAASRNIKARQHYKPATYARRWRKVWAFMNASLALVSFAGIGILLALGF